MYTEKLSKALRTAAEWISTGTVNYCWITVKDCNCGVLAQALGASEFNVLELAARNSQMWSDVKMTCEQTGLPLCEAFGRLIECGLTEHDLHHLEFCNDPVIQRRAGLNVYAWNKIHYIDWMSSPDGTVGPDYMYPMNVVAYMRAWADMIDEQLAQDAVAVLPVEQTAGTEMLLTV